MAIDSEDEITQKYLTALYKAVRANPDDKNLDNFSDNVISNFQTLNSDQKLKNQINDLRPTTSALAATSEPLETLQRVTGITNNQIKLLRTQKILDLAEGKLIISFKNILPKKIAFSIATALFLITGFLTVGIFMIPVMQPSHWLLLFSVGHLIGVGIRKTADRSFRIYNLQDKLKSLGPWVA